jgi:hypothetical protein
LEMGNIRGFSLKTTLVDSDDFVGSMEPSDHQGTETTCRAGDGNRTWKGTRYFLVFVVVVTEICFSSLCATPSTFR